MNHENTGALIAQRRRQLGLTQKDLADQLKISDRTVSKWERGAGFPDISLIEPLSDALGLTVLELLHGQENPPPQEAEESALEALNSYLPEIETSRKRTRRCIALLAIMLLVVTALLIWVAGNILGDEIGEVQITASEAASVSPYILITSQDMELLEALRQDDAVIRSHSQKLVTLDAETIVPYEAMIDRQDLELTYFIVQVLGEDIHVEYGTDVIRIALEVDDGRIVKTVAQWPAPYPYLEGGRPNPESTMQLLYLVRNFDNTDFFKRQYESGLGALF